jgi:manganese efflux pump family protein
MTWAALITWVITAGGAIWFRRRQAGAAGTELAAPGAPAEQHFPVSVVTLHGLLAVTTVVLVLLTARKVGGS